MVSIPLRGLGLFRRYRGGRSRRRSIRFNPLAGIRAFQTIQRKRKRWLNGLSFNPLAGIRAFQTVELAAYVVDNVRKFQSPCGD